MKPRRHLALPAFALAAFPLAQAADIVRSADRDATVKEHSDASVEERFEREQWNLNEAEWARYRSLMHGMRASVSPPTLSPIEVLGIHAQNDRERKDYAKRWAEMMRQDTQRILAFQAAYDAAWREIEPSGKIFDPADILKNLPAKAPEWVKAGDRVLLFVRLPSCAKCEDYARAAKEAAAKGAHVDIYVAGARDEEIRAWATQRSFDMNAVKSGRITLNHEKGELAKILGIAPVLPKLIRIRDHVATNVEP
jgi:integrating conjugative element protein (TIGR03759 family)